MEFANFIKLLFRYKYTLIFVPLITVLITFFLVRNLPDSYESTTRIATGIVEGSGALTNNEGYVQESKINQEFSNLIQIILLKKIVNQVSYQLMIHDLSTASAYRKPSTLLKNLNAAERKQALNLFTQKYAHMEDLSLLDNDQKQLYKLLTSMKYDYKSLNKVLNVYRLENSDYILLKYTSENPQLSATVLNTLCKEFIDYYTATETQNRNKVVTYLDSLMAVKQASLKSKMESLKNYKIRNHVLDVNEQASVLMGQIADFQAKKQEAQKNINAYSGALQNVTNKVDVKEKVAADDDAVSTASTQEILASRSRLNALNEEYIKHNFDPKYKSRIDSLQNVITSQINRSNERSKSSSGSASSNQDLVKQKLDLEVNLELAKNSVSSLDNEVNNLTRKLNVLAPNQATIQAFEKDIEMEGREYVELTKKYNQASMEASFPIKIKQIELAMPGAAEPSKKILLVLLAGIASFMLCVVALFIAFYFDHSINDVQQLANQTQIPVIGALTNINGYEANLAEIWENKNDTASLKQLKSQLRSLRFEIDSELSVSKIVGITSLRSQEGKTFLAWNLAYAYKMINKKVLLIDGNFEQPQISESAKAHLFLEDYLLAKVKVPAIETSGGSLVVMGNKGNDISLLEISNYTTISSRLKALQDQFDIILVEIPSLDMMNKSKEWIAFMDKVVPVFGAGQSIKDSEKKEIEYLKKIEGKMLGWIMNKVAATKEKTKTKKISNPKTVYA